jgi:hypothetical protein
MAVRDSTRSSCGLNSTERASARLSAGALACASAASSSSQASPIGVRMKASSTECASGR